MRAATPDEGMGILQSVLDVEAARGNPAQVDVESRLASGLPPVARLARPLDRDVIESQLDLGPLVAWWPRSRHELDLVDTVTGTTIESGVPGRSGWWHRRKRPEPAAVQERSRVGWLADDPRIGPSATGTWSSTARRARVHVSGSAVEAFTRIDQVLAAVDAPDGRVELPAWFADLLAPVRDDDQWGLYFAERARLHTSEWKVAGWTTRWTEPYWRAAMTPVERTWGWVDAEVAHEHALDVVVDVVDDAPIGSLTWLLVAVGAVRCGPYDSDA